MRALWIVLVVACGSPKPISENRLRVELTPALEPLAWWLGDWEIESGVGTEHWVAASGAIYGIALHGGGRFEVMIVDDGEGTGKPDGFVRFIAMPGGTRAVEFKQTVSGKTSVTFANPEHDAPKEIVYARDGQTLSAKLDNEIVARFTPTNAKRAPELEQADLAFAKDTAARGIEGWVAAFDAKGAMMRKGGRVEGADAIREMMSPLLAKTKVEWAPIASGRHGDIGFTVGKATFTGEESWRSTYVTIWKQQAHQRLRGREILLRDEVRRRRTRDRVVKAGAHAERDDRDDRDPHAAPQRREAQPAKVGIPSQQRARPPHVPVPASYIDGSSRRALRSASAMWNEEDRSCRAGLGTGRGFDHTAHTILRDRRPRPAEREPLPERDGNRTTRRVFAALSAVALS